MAGRMICVVVMGFLFSGCASVESRWKATQQQDTVAGYESFIRKYPNAEETSSARDRIKNLKFEQAKAQGNIMAFERFVVEYPGDPLSRGLRNRLLGLLLIDWASEVGEVSVRYDLNGNLLDRVPIPITRKVGERNIPKLRELLAAGADPSAIRIEGFRPVRRIGPHASDIAPGMVFQTQIRGEPGHVVEGGQGGLTLLEYCKANNLDEAGALLGGNRDRPPAIPASEATRDGEESLLLRSAQEAVREMGFRSEPLLDERSFLMWVGPVSVTISAANQTLASEVWINADLVDDESSGNEGYKLLRVQKDDMGKRRVWLRSEMPKPDGPPFKELVRIWLQEYLRETGDYLKKHKNQGSSSVTTGSGCGGTPSTAAEPVLSDLKGKAVEDLLNAKGLPWERDEKTGGIVIRPAGQRNMLIVHWTSYQTNSFDFFTGPGDGPTTKDEIVAFNRKARYLELTPSSDGNASAHAKLDIPEDGIKESDFKSWLYGCLDDVAILGK